MNDQETLVKSLRIGTDEVLAHLQGGKPVTVLDVRNDKPWEASTIQVRGAVRIQPADWHIDPLWPKDVLTVVY